MNDEKKLEQFKGFISKAPKTVNLGSLESQVLSYAIDNREFFLFCNKMLNPEHLEDKTNQIVWSFIKAYFKKNGGILPSREVLKQEFSKKNIELPIPDLDERSKDYIKQKVFNVIKMQKFEEILLSAMIAAEAGENEFDDSITNVYHKLQEIVFLKPEMNLGINYFQVEERMNKFLDYWSNRIPTGFPSLDICLPGGGIGRKEVVCFLGSSGVGKCCHPSTLVEIELELFVDIKDNSTIIRMQCPMSYVYGLKQIYPNANIKCKTENGFKTIKNVWITQPNKEWYLETSNGKQLLCADDHKVNTNNGFIQIQKLQDQLVETIDGFESIVACYPTGNIIPMIDFCMDGEHYFSNDILSHNSVWLVNIGSNLIKQGYKVLHFTREISEEIIGMRYDACLLNKTTEDILKEPAKTIANVKDLKYKYDINPNCLWIKEFPTYGSNMEDSQSYAAMLKERYNFIPDVIIDDYIDLAKPNQYMKNKYEAQGQTFGEFRGWMVSEGIAGITATQAQRGAEKTDGPIRMDQTADSIDKVRLADVFISINETFEESIQGFQRLFFAKNRNQKAAMMSKFKVDKSRMSIIDINDFYEVGKYKMEKNESSGDINSIINQIQEEDLGLPF